ncbi:MAG: hypothetical protein JWM11_3007 [Planctomycetaceae bacterium]|nr:hypothetical protein [Planctomycetaceae bacterium]
MYSQIPLPTTMWFSDIVNYYDPSGTLGLSDERIQSAVPFEGYCQRYLDWPKIFWENPELGIPCHDLDKNAYHVLRIADQMEAGGLAWIGGELELHLNGEITEGRHRLRAVRFLFESRGIVIPEPQSIQIHFSDKTGSKTVFGSGPHPIAARANFERIVTKLECVVSPNSAVAWLNVPHLALQNRSPLAAMKHGEFEKVLQIIESMDR